MNIAVIYNTKTGHTKLIAEAIAGVFGVEARNILDKPELNKIDLLFVGTGIYAGKVTPELTTYLDAINSTMVKKAILFTTSMSPKIQTALLRDFIARKGIEVLRDEFNCRGKFLFFNGKRPNEQDANNAKEFAKKYLTK